MGTKLLSVRLDADLERRLEQQAPEGEKSSLAKRYIDEGIRMDRHPGIVFRPGPAGRRPALAAGPDVWEVIRVVNNVPERGDKAIASAARWLGLHSRQVHDAVAYYAEYRDEIDDWIARVDREAEEAERLWHRQREALA